MNGPLIPSLAFSYAMLIWRQYERIQEIEDNIKMVLKEMDADVNWMGLILVVA